MTGSLDEIYRPSQRMYRPRWKCEEYERRDHANERGERGLAYYQKEMNETYLTFSHTAKNTMEGFTPLGLLKSDLA